MAILLQDDKFNKYFNRYKRLIEAYSIFYNMQNKYMCVSSLETKRTLTEVGIT